MKNISFYGVRVFVCCQFLLASGICSATPVPEEVPICAIQLNDDFIKGVVTFEGMPMAGVTVVREGIREKAKGKSLATLTDAEGKFSITATAGDVLVFSYTGFKTKKITVGMQTNLKVSLEEETTDLKEVTVNAGYYSVKDSERTGSIAKITAKDIEKQPVTNVLAAMQGRMAGVSVTQETGMPGGGFNIQIRGLGSLRTEGNQPLYVIDGVPYASDMIGTYQTSTSFPTPNSPLNSINPSDIESLEILKDADATAIYGSRGANGVVLVTTKRGRTGKTTFSVNTLHGASSVTRMMDLMNTEQYLKMRRQAFINDGLINYPANAYDVNGRWSQDRYTDWQEVLIGGTATTSSLQGTVSGGSEQTQFLFSSNYLTQTTVFPGDFEYRRGGAHLSLNHRSEDSRFTIGFTGSYTAQNNRLPWSDLTRISRTLAPNAPALYDANGNLNWENGTWSNPLASFNGKVKSQTYDLVANALISYKLTKNLHWRTSLGFSDLRNSESRTSPSTLYNPAMGADSQNSALFTSALTRQSWIAEPQLQWKPQIGASGFDLLAGATLQQQIGNRLSHNTYGFTSNSLIYDLASALQVSVGDNAETVYKYQAFFARLNYSLYDKYFINLTGRRDGSSRFGPGRQFATFGAVGVSWLLHKEKWMNPLEWVTFAKLRASYGTVGNDQIGDYQFLHTYQSSGLQYGGIKGLQPSRLYNPDFGWESTKKLEIALETGFFDDRIFITAAWYRNRSSNQLVGLPLPAITGFTSLQANLNATVENRGYELTLRTLNIRGKDFNWTSSLNISLPKNELLSFPGLEQSTYKNMYVIGQPITIKRFYHYTGLEAGGYTFEDFNGNGAITAEDDKQVLIDFSPKYFGGFQNQLSWKKLSLDFLFQFVKQQNYNYAYTQQYPGTMRNQPVAFTDAWQQPGDTATYQMYTTGVNAAAVKSGGFYQESDAAVSDASFIRLKNIALSYDLPPIKSLRCRLYVQGQNLLTITSYKGADPEFRTAGYLPPLKTIAAGLQLTF